MIDIGFAKDNKLGIESLSAYSQKLTQLIGRGKFYHGCSRGCLPHQKRVKTRSASIKP